MSEQREDGYAAPSKESTDIDRQCMEFVETVLELRDGTTRQYLKLVHAFAGDWFGQHEEERLSAMFAITFLTKLAREQTLHTCKAIGSQINNVTPLLHRIWPQFEPIAQRQVKASVELLLAGKCALCGRA